MHDLVLWLNPPSSWKVNRRYLTIPNPPKPVSQETRNLELEAKSPNGLGPGAVEIPGYALYYVCEDINGTCLYRRQDLSLRVTLR